MLNEILLIALVELIKSWKNSFLQSKIFDFNNN